MKWDHKKKLVSSGFRITWLVILAIITYRLYNYYKTENLAEYQMQNSRTDSNHTVPVKPATTPVRPFTMRDSLAKEIDSIKKASTKDSLPSFDVHINPSSEQNDSVALVPAALPPRNHPEKIDRKNADDAAVLQGPSPLFSRVFTIAAGKTIPVNILWADSGTTAASFKLITIKADNIADEKARFTIEDPFHVLLFSQTEYAAHDKIIIEDEKHNLNISVLRVNTNSVVVNVVSQLNENIINTLQKVE